MPEPRDLYKVLQVDSEADPDVIQAAYRRLAQKYHPDLASGDIPAARMIAINAAWEVLGDRARRAAYDRERARQARMAASSAPEGPSAASPSPAHRQPRANPSASQPPPPGTSGGGDAPGNGRPGEPVSGDWTTGRSTFGGGYDPRTMRAPEGHGAAGPPPGNPSGSLVTFGRYAGWSLGEIARHDLEFLEWLERSPAGRQYRGEIDGILRQAGRRRAGGDDSDRRGLFRR